MFFKLKITKILKLGWRGLGKSELPWEPNFYSRRCIAFRTISLPGFNGLCCKLPEIALFIIFDQNSVEFVTSSVISFTYFTHFSNVNISGTNTDIKKR